MSFGMFNHFGNSGTREELKKVSIEEISTIFYGLAMLGLILDDNQNKPFQRHSQVFFDPFSRHKPQKPTRIDLTEQSS